MGSYTSDNSYFMDECISENTSPLHYHTPNRSTTVKCRYFMNNGYCFYGDACQFLHISPTMSNGTTHQRQEEIHNYSTEDDSAFVDNTITLASKKTVQDSDQSKVFLFDDMRPSNKETLSAEMLQQHFRRMRLMQKDTDTELPPKKQSCSRNLSPLQFSGYKCDKTSYFMSQQIRMELQKQRSFLMAESKEPGLPENIENYHSLLPLENIKNPKQGQKLLGYASSCYRVMNSKDGLHYCMRRIHGFRLLNPKAVTSVEQWKKVVNSNIVQLKEAFTTKAFGDTSLVFIYNYYPGAETLMSRHFSGPETRSPTLIDINSWSLQQNSTSSSSSLKNITTKKATQKVIPERLIWSYVIQLSASIRQIHSQGLCCRVIDPSKILLIGNSRLRLNCCGILDILTSDASDPTTPSLMSHYQQEDLVSFGKLILALACYSVEAVHRDNMQLSLEFVARHYSNDLKTLIWHLLSSQITSNPHNINEVMPVIGARFYSQLDSAQARCELLENELSKELDNGRLLRILAKLGTILERSEFNMDPEWSETGDRYLLKLFRDYLFHQVTETGSPWIDFAHIVSVLNKLDSGSSERICLSSRDEQSILVVSYHDIKACLETAFSELTQPLDVS
ncbi:PAN2-PAN3 deadenylation complex subunit pan3 isoform X2 [Hydra vulgaris]|uniref:PAN2-PAN3 deadenylation complex subunit PAN3 n=1 Tax=Hydra vulgaris TaxID=6087 RepID=A0ABM4D2W2_HYDVU